MADKNKYHKLIELLNQEITDNNEQEQLAALGNLLGKNESDFEAGFNAQLMQRMQAEGLFEQTSTTERTTVKTDEFSNKIVHLFKRVALSGAAAILLLMVYSWYVDGNLSTDSLLGLTQIEDAAWDISSSFNSNY